MSIKLHPGRASLLAPLAVALSIAAPGSAFAQSPPAAAQQPPKYEVAQGATTLSPMEVTAPRRQAKKGKGDAPVAKAPAGQPPAPQEASASASPAVLAPGFPAQSGGQTLTTIQGGRTGETRAFTTGDLLQESPGISIKQGNGPRDMSVSIRGSNARNGFGVRNIQVFEDGFPVTQPDGLSRTDLTDPHAYAGIDVWRGPSSALFGNYATGGAINFRSRPGAEINGFEYGTDFGSFGYLNNYLQLGAKSGSFEYSLFASDVRGDGHLDNNAFDTQTVDFLGIYTPTPRDRFTVKFIRNDLDADLSLRLSLNQFNLNPFQKGCTVAQGAAPGCATINLFANGFNANDGQKAVTAAQAGLGRDDQRTILGTRWEHKIDASTDLQVQLVVDDRNINQPTGTTSAIGDFLSYNLMSHLAHRYSFLGMPATHLMGVYYNTLPNDNDTVNLLPAGNAALGNRTQNVTGETTNAGARLREEIEAGKAWTVVLGTSLEWTQLTGVSTAFGYAGSLTGDPSSVTTVSADREFLNRAYEAGLVYRANEQLQFRSRVATGYGTPQIGNLFVTPAGVAGNNTDLQPQTNLGYDLGFDWATRTFKLSATGFYEFFENELVTQSAGVGLQNFTFNAPASEHRGVEIAADWRPLPGWRGILAYTYNDQIYTDHSERLSAGGKTALLDRAGNKIPGNPPNELLARVGYDQPFGALKGLGAFIEYQWKDSFFLDNGNLLEAPGYELVNFNVHYRPELASTYFKGLSLYFEVRNLFDTTYIASANNIASSLNGTTGLEDTGGVLANRGSIYAGLPRTFYGGVKITW